MAKINETRVLVGGALATIVVLALSGIVWLLLLRDASPGGLLLRPTAGALALWGAAVYGLSTAAVWIYAAIRPRFGPGPRTAALAGLAVWVVTALTDLLWVTLLAQGPAGEPGGRTLAAMAAYAVIFPLATMAGARPYREGDSGSPGETSGEET